MRVLGGDAATGGNDVDVTDVRRWAGAPSEADVLRPVLLPVLVAYQLEWSLSVFCAL